MKESVKNIISFTSGIIIGGAAGFIIAQKVMKTTMDRELEEQIRDVKEHYKLLRKEGEYSTPESVLGETTREIYDEVLEGLEYLQHEVENVEEVIEDDEDEDDDESLNVEEEVVEVGNVFERNKKDPYVISTLDFMNGEDSFDKVTITYFEEDDTLCDEREEVIPNVEATVGLEALTSFGKLSDDAKIVYVRNERIKTDFEIALDTRSYTEVVLGFKEEKEVRKMREDD